MLWFLSILSLKNGPKGKPKIPLDTLPILGYFPVIAVHHFFKKQLDFALLGDL
jgi:hypothetical protein